MHKRDEKHVYSFIDPFNHIVDAKKIIIQDDWYWVTMRARDSPLNTHKHIDSS